MGFKSINSKGIYPQTDTEVLFWPQAQYFLIWIHHPNRIQWG